MKNETFNAGQIIDTYYIVSAIWGIVITILIIFIAYFLVRLYKKISKFLENQAN